MKLIREFEKFPPVKVEAGTICETFIVTPLPSPNCTLGAARKLTSIEKQRLEGNRFHRAGALKSHQWEIDGL